MRKILLLGSALMFTFAAPAFAGHFKTDGTFVGKVSPRVQKAINAYARTQDAAALQKDIATLLANDPGLADDVVFASTNLPADEQTAIANGLAQAEANLLAKDPNSPGAAAIKTAEGFAPQPFQTAYTTELNTLLGQASLNGGNGNGGGGGNGGSGTGGGVGSSAPTSPAPTVSPS
jgi:hypothetical protein